MFQFDFSSKIHKVRIALKGSRKKSPFLNGRAIQTLPPGAPSSIMAVGTFSKKIYFP